MRRYLFYFLLLLAAAPAAAQPALLPPPAPAAPDTVAALHRLFAHKRHVRNSLLIAGTSVAVGSLLGTRGAYDLGTAAILVVPALAGLVTVGVSCAHYGDFNAKEEASAIEAFKAHHLPQFLRRKLKAKYFRESKSASHAHP